MYTINKKILAFLPPETIEPEALRQLYNTSESPVLAHHLAVMPDCHFGKGSTVGSVIPTAGGIIPAAVGVDIGCGMIAVQTIFNASQLPENLKTLESGIEKRIPLGAGGKNSKITATARKRIEGLAGKAAVDYRKYAGWQEQMGTLGSGNHFVEICLDEDQRVWLVLHSGSRGVGNQIASYHIKIAQKLMAEAHVPLKDRDLAHLPEGTQEFKDYIRDLLWAQDFALANREETLKVVSEQLKAPIPVLETYLLKDNDFGRDPGAAPNFPAIQKMLDIYAETGMLPKLDVAQFKHPTIVAPLQ
jgi:tRNA-splicing ligase RtcB